MEKINGDFLVAISAKLKAINKNAKQRIRIHLLSGFRLIAGPLSLVDNEVKVALSTNQNENVNRFRTFRGLKQIQELFVYDMARSPTESISILNSCDSVRLCTGKNFAILNWFFFFAISVTNGWWWREGGGGMFIYILNFKHVNNLHFIRTLYRFNLNSIINVKHKCLSIRVCTFTLGVPIN